MTKPGNRRFDPTLPRQDVILRVRNMAGASRATWEIAKLRALKEFGYAIDVPMCCNILMVPGFDCLKQVELSIEYLNDIIKHEDEPTINRIAAAQAMVQVSRGYQELADHLIKLAEKGANGSSKKAKNLPPMTATQVNVYPQAPGAGPAPAVSVISGTPEPPAIADRPEPEPT